MGDDEETEDSMVTSTTSYGKSRQSFTDWSSATSTYQSIRIEYILDFDFIEIFNDTIPYPKLLGIGWVMENLAVINFKKRTMSFENSDPSPHLTPSKDNGVLK